MVRRRRPRQIRFSDGRLGDAVGDGGCRISPSLCPERTTHAPAQQPSLRQRLLHQGAHSAERPTCSQIGAGGADHAWWGPSGGHADGSTGCSNHLILSGSTWPGDGGGHGRLVNGLSPDRSGYADTLLLCAQQLYAFADQFRGKYSDCITDARNFYNSWSGFNDELVWGAIWLYRATNDPAYLTRPRPTTPT